jgi:phosphoribosyl-ATP pyrophosphohydrolase
MMAAKDGQPDAIVYEMADLWFHTLVVLGWHNIPPQQVFQELQQRFGKSGLRTQRASHVPQPPGQSA